MLNKVLTCKGDEIIFFADDVLVPKAQIKVKRERVESIYPNELREEVSLRVLKAKELKNVLKANIDLRRELKMNELKMFQYKSEKFLDVLESIQKVEVIEEVTV